VYRRFAEVDGAGTLPLYGRVAIALSESDEALRAIETAPPRRRQPALILAALHDLALAERAPALAAAYAAADVDTLLGLTDEVVATAVRRRTRPDETGRCAVLHPAIAEAASRVGARAVGLIDVGCSAGLNLYVDRVGISYSNGQTLGDPSSPVRFTASLLGDRPERAVMLDAELALAATDPPLLLTGDAVDLLPDALARVPADALPVVVTTWALSQVPLESRLRFLQRLDAAATDRPVAWVSVEGVGVAPAVPTFGDRPASGHSIIGLAVFGHSVLRAEALGRCWSRGRMLSWLADL
jgi:hypothetical protein